MIEELLKIISEAEKLISQPQPLSQNERLQYLTSGFQELQELDDKIYRHFQEDQLR